MIPSLAATAFNLCRATLPPADERRGAFFSTFRPATSGSEPILVDLKSFRIERCAMSQGARDHAFERLNGIVDRNPVPSIKTAKAHQAQYAPLIPISYDYAPVLRRGDLATDEVPVPSNVGPLVFALGTRNTTLVHRGSLPMVYWPLDEHEEEMDFYRTMHHGMGQALLSLDSRFTGLPFNPLFTTARLRGQETVSPSKWLALQMYRGKSAVLVCDEHGRHISDDLMRRWFDGYDQTFKSLPASPIVKVLGFASFLGKVPLGSALEGGDETGSGTCHSPAALLSSDPGKRLEIRLRMSLAGLVIADSVLSALSTSKALLVPPGVREMVFFPAPDIKAPTAAGAGDPESESPAL